MNNFNNNANNYYGGGMQQMQGGYTTPGMSYGTPIMYTGAPQMPVIKSPLTSEEINMMKSVSPSKLDISISPVDSYRAMCNHHDEFGNDKVVQLNDNSGLVYCTMCQSTWDPSYKTKEDVIEIVNNLISAMQNAKYVGVYGAELTRDYFPMIPLLEKFPDIYEYAMKTFDKFYNANQYKDANDMAVYNQYNSLVGGYNQPMYAYGYPMGQQPVNNNAYGQQMNGQPVNNMYGQPANNAYGYAQQPMNAYGYPMGQQPVNNAYGYAQQPVNAYGYPMANQQAAPATAVNPMQAPVNYAQPANNNNAYMPAAASQTTQTPDGSKITNNANGTTTSEKTVNL